MHKYPQNQSYVGSNGQILTTNVSMTLCHWQIRHQTHVLCGCTAFVPNQLRHQSNTVLTPAVAWTRAQLLQGGVHNNVMEEVVQKQICPCKYLKFGPVCLNLRSKCMYRHATHMRCPAYLNSCSTSTTTIKKPVLGRGVAPEKCRGTRGWFLRKVVPRIGGRGR